MGTGQGPTPVPLSGHHPGTRTAQTDVTASQLLQDEQGWPAEAGEKQGSARGQQPFRGFREVDTPEPSPEQAPLPGELHREQAPRELGHSHCGRNARVGRRRAPSRGAGQRRRPLPEEGAEAPGSRAEGGVGTGVSTRAGPGLERRACPQPPGEAVQAQCQAFGGTH